MGTWLWQRLCDEAPKSRVNRRLQGADGSTDSDSQRLTLEFYVDITLLVKAAIMGVVQGLTEFLPISSTGHLILAGALLGFDDEKAKVFDIAIQTGAIFVVILVCWQKIRETVALTTRPGTVQTAIAWSGLLTGN